MNAKPQGWFITGTDTGVGKTAIAEALLAALARRRYRAAGMKPVASGCRRTADGLRSEDAERLRAAASVATDYTDSIRTPSSRPSRRMSRRPGLVSR
jgi:dethiobiotin synthetase